MNVSFIWMIRVIQWTSIFLTLKNFDVSDFNDHVIVNVAILKIFSFEEDVSSVSCFGFTKNVCACLQRCKTVRIRFFCIAKAYFVLTFQWLWFNSFTWGKLVAEELDGKHDTRFMTHHAKSVLSPVYPDFKIIDYFTVGERVRFLFTTSK